MGKIKIAGPLKDFTNLDEVLDRMLKLGFFGGYEALRDEAWESMVNYDPTSAFSQNEFWYSNSVVEVKIFRHMFGSYELCNYRQQSHRDLDELFELATVPRIA